MSEKKVCPNPECNSGNVYVLIHGEIICRACGYDGRKVEGTKKRING